MAEEVIVKRSVKLVLIDDWHRAWKYLSIQFSALGFLLMGAAEVLGSSWSGLPPDIRDKIPHAQTIAMVLFALTMLGRVVRKRDKISVTTTTDNEAS